MTTTQEDAADDLRHASGLAADFFTDDDPPGTDRRTKVIALWGVGIVVAILSATVGLVRLTDVGPGRAASPEAAAKQWLTAVVAGRRPNVSTSCIGPAYTSALVAVDGRPHTTVDSVRLGAKDHWIVTMRIDSPRQSVPVHVERHSGDYVVC